MTSPLDKIINPKVKHTVESLAVNASIAVGISVTEVINSQLQNHTFDWAVVAGAASAAFVKWLHGVLTFTEPEVVAEVVNGSPLPPIA